MQQHTPLYEQHIAQGAVLTAFHGWQMPLHYGSQVKEHHAVRQAAGVFDVSHMTVVDCIGAGSCDFLRYLLANDVAKLSGSPRALYSVMLNHDAGILDDLIVYHLAEDQYRLVLNSATKAADMAWLTRQSPPFDVTLRVRPDLAILAIQGPFARMKCEAAFSRERGQFIRDLAVFDAGTMQDWFIARTGYTGEDGIEVLLPAREVATVWHDLLAVGVEPCGLGARDSLRLEAGMLLYGQDMDQHTTPLESNLGWSVAWQPAERDFIGREKLAQHRQQGKSSQLVGLVLAKSAGIMRTGQLVQTPEGGQGRITSGGFSPCLGCSIALARIPLTAATSVAVSIRGKTIPARIVKPRFVKNGKLLVEGE